MKNDQLLASMFLECFICKSMATRENVVLWSERVAHLHCAQCGYEIVLVSFRFEKTNFGIHFQTKIMGKDTDYDQVTYAGPSQYLNVKLKNPKGAILIIISGNQ